MAAVCAATDVAGRVDPQQVDARALPFRDDEFDAAPAEGIRLIQLFDSQFGRVQHGPAE